MKITLTKLTKFTKDKDGNPLKTKDGRNYTRLLINSNEYGERTLSGFDGEQTQNWQIGDTVEVEIKEVEFNDKKYLNFSVPKKENLNQDKLDKILVELAFIHNQVNVIAQHVIKDDYPTPESEGIDPRKAFTE